MSSINIFLVMALSLIIPKNQNKSNMEDFLPKWDRACEYTLNVIDLMPEEKFNFRPTDEVMSFKEQIVHITGNLYALTGRYITEEKIEKWNKFDGNYTKDELVSQLEKAFNMVRSNAQEMNDTDAEEKINFFTGELLSKKEVFGVMRDHMTHHRSQMITYLRLNNIKPPQYVGW